MAFFRLALFLLSISAVTFAAHPNSVPCRDGSTASHAMCCAFNHLRDDLLHNLFGGVCGEEAHESLRLAFHDAIGFSRSLGPKAGGGADGSPIIFGDIEPNFHANQGIIDAVNFLSPFLLSRAFVSHLLCKFAAAVGITNCPGAPRLEFLAGRPHPKMAAIDGLVPEAHQSLDTIFARMKDGGDFTHAEVAALLASHSIARSDHIVPGGRDLPFDSTPFVFDTQFFVEIQLRGIGFPADGKSHPPDEVKSPLPYGSGQNAGEIRIASDFKFARDHRTACTFQSFVNNQKLMSRSFAAAMAKLALIGQNPRHLIDCSESVPKPLPALNTPAMLPHGKTMRDIEAACVSAPFPKLATNPRRTYGIPHCPPQQGGSRGNCDEDEGSL